MNGSRQKARVFQMQPNVERIVHSISLLISEAAQRKTPITQYDIVKAVFLADRGHLNKFGRPITYDDYVAMKYGPVPSLVYDLLKENKDRMGRIGLRKLPWERRAAPELGKNCFAYENTSIKPSDDVLSLSDIEELTAALTVVQTLGFQQIKKLTHDDPAYIDAWDDEGDADQYPMSYTLFFDVPNEELAQELAFVSKHV